MNMNQTKLNANYQDILNKVYGGEISLRDKYLNPHAVILHHCKKCMKNFWDKPLWLVNKRQSHDCFDSPIEKVKKVKKTAPKKAEGTKKGDCTPNKVTEPMKAEMILLYKQGESLKSISRKFEVTPPTVKRHIGGF